MTDAKGNRLEFHCPQCDKLLRAGEEIAGRKVKCPGCKTVVRVPGARQEKPKADDDWLSLDGALGGPAIGDLDARKQAAESIQQEKEQKRKKASKIAKRKVGEPLYGDDSAAQKKSAAAPLAGKADTISASKQTSQSTRKPVAAAGTQASGTQASGTQASGTQASGTQASGTQASGTQASGSPTAAQAPESNDKPLPSIFDDDLQLEALEPADAPPVKTNVEDVLAAHLGADDLGDSFGNDISGGDDAGAELVEEAPDEKNPEYRITCPTCGTAQYVRLAQKGQPLKCPDCYDTFRIPPPTAVQIAKQKNKKKKPAYSSEPDVGLAAADESIFTQEQRQRSQAASLLEKAQQEISEDDIEKLYDSDFDTSTFLNRTFGCFRDPICIAQIIGYGLVFGTLFSLGSYAVLNSDTAFGKGLILLVGIFGTFVGMLFAMPMLSGCLALLESVANRQPKVSEWPGFNLFDNVGDVLVIFASLLAAILPGFLVGGLIGRSLALGATVQITAMMITTFALFPIFLLSMLDNGSIVQPISRSIIRSMTEAAEAWGGYFLKTLIAFSSVTLLWYLLLNAGPAAAGIAGFFLPVLAFFTCQQIGALADSISEHLSFEFDPGGDDDDDESDRVEIKD